MAYENNNVRAGANGVGVYVGNTEIMGRGTNIIPLNLYSDSSSTDILLANLLMLLLHLNFILIIL